MFERPTSQPKPPVFQGREFPFTHAPINLVGAMSTTAQLGQLPPSLPAVRPEFPVDPRGPLKNQLINYEPAWGVSRGIGIWDGMPLQFFPSLIAYQPYELQWSPVYGMPTPNIARGNPAPLTYTYG